MSEGTTAGVLLRGEDGTHYFIPHTDLSAYAVSDVPEPLTAGAGVADNVPRLHAFSVERVEDAARMPMPEAGAEAAAAFVPMPEGGPSAAGQA